jgi:predicted translin family RNA/ssDNA-binding protein
MQRECIAKISNSLLMYANVYLNPGVSSKEESLIVSSETRKLAAELLASCHRIPFYRTLTKTRIFPSIEVVSKVQRNLVGLSNSLFSGEASHNHDMSEEIKQLLNIKFD